MRTLSRIRPAVLVLALGVAAAAPGRPAAAESAAGDPAATVEEPSSGKRFPRTVTVVHDGRSYTLHASGTAVRKKFVFKVYGMAHYIDVERFPSIDDALEAALDDGHAKQITMVFSRGVDVEKIRNAYREGFRKNASDDDWEAIQASLDRFLEAYDRPVEEDDVFIVRWLPGGVVQSVVQGREAPPIVDETFARVLWRIWLGEKSIVDRDRLFSIAVPGTD